MTRAILVLASILVAAAPAGAVEPPLALSAAVQTLGRGAEGSVVGVAIQIAPEDRERLGERARVSMTLLDGADIVDLTSAVVTLEPDGSVLLYQEWPVGNFELRVEVVAAEGAAAGLWIGDVSVEPSDEPFVAPQGATPDAVALELLPSPDQAVTFKPPPDIGGIGALGLEVEAPEATASVEFFQDGEPLGRRNRPPWTVSVRLGDVIRRTEVRAVARDADGRYLGEDALVLNNPTGQIGVQILLGPEPPDPATDRRITVSVTSPEPLRQVSLQLDDQVVARWAGCPCVVDVPQRRLAEAMILSADAVDVEGTRGDQVMALGAGGGFVGTVRVELVELPVVVLDANGAPVLGLAQGDFTVFEDDDAVTVEGFGTTADLPLSLVLAVDTSGSMLEAFPEVRQAVAGFAGALLEPGDEAALVRFSWDAAVEVEWTDDFRRIGGALDRIVPDGGTSLNDAVVRSLEQFRGRRGRQALVLLTDGEDTTSRTDFHLAERFAHTMRIPVFPIGLGLGRLGGGNRGVLKSLAAETGGEAFFPKSVEELPAVYDRIAELLRSQYLLWYPSDSSKPTDTFREIRVEVADSDLTVRTIRGYYPGK
jgi:Ca-activated chloride channel family protein